MPMRVLASRPRRRGGASAERRRHSWCGAATGRWRRSCSCCPTTGHRPRSRAPSSACRPVSPVPIPIFSTASVATSEPAACGPRGCSLSARSLLVLGLSCSADRPSSWPRVAYWPPSSGSVVRVWAASSPARELTRTRDLWSCCWPWPWCQRRSRIRQHGTLRSPMRSFDTRYSSLGDWWHWSSVCSSVAPIRPRPRSRPAWQCRA